MTSSFRSVFRDGLFAGRHVLVTGGGSGIGRCTAHELAHLGARVSLLGRNAERLRQVARELDDAGHPGAQWQACDIRDEGAVQAAVATLIAGQGPIDGLAHCAGGQFMAPLRDISAKGFDAVVRNNLTGGFLVAREVFVQSMERHGGAIVNVIADMWRSMPGLGHSGAARAGMLNLTQTAAVEWAGRGVRVNAVAPGYIASDGLNRYPVEARPYLARLKDCVPLGRLGTESEVSAAIVFLLSEAAAFISGSCIRVDGAAPNARLDARADPANAVQSAATEPFRGFAMESRVAFL